MFFIVYYEYVIKNEIGSNEFGNSKWFMNEENGDGCCKNGLGINIWICDGCVEVMNVIDIKIVSKKGFIDYYKI